MVNEPLFRPGKRGHVLCATHDSPQKSIPNRDFIFAVLTVRNLKLDFLSPFDLTNRLFPSVEYLLIKGSSYKFLNLDARRENDVSRDFIVFKVTSHYVQ